MRLILALLFLVSMAVQGTTTVGALEPTTGTWRAYRGSNFSTLVCSNSSEAAMLACIAADAERRATTTRYQLRYPNRYVTVTYARPTCPPAPAPQTTSQTCPAGTTGTWNQTATTTFGPPPECTPTINLSPTEPPADRCVPNSPPPTETWTFCAHERQLCSFTGTRRVRYGAGTTWVERDVTAASGGVQCANSVFGDPAVGITKRCELRAEPAGTGAASLTWTAPTRNTDGSSLTNLAGYRISYGTNQDELVQTVQIENPGTTAYTVDRLAPGTYFFAVRAYTSSGTESANSNVESKVIN